jgi:hypothetical protein
VTLCTVADQKRRLPALRAPVLSIFRSTRPETRGKTGGAPEGPVWPSRGNYSSGFYRERSPSSLAPVPKVANGARSTHETGAT